MLELIQSFVACIIASSLRFVARPGACRAEAIAWIQMWPFESESLLVNKAHGPLPLRDTLQGLASPTISL